MSSDTPLTDSEELDVQAIALDQPTDQQTEGS